MPVNWLNQPEWKGSLEWETLFLNDTFPAALFYHESIWAEWESRIKRGQELELNRVAQLQTKWEKDLKLRPHDSLPEEIADTFADDVFKTSRLTNTMYAALIVSIWSDMEHFLTRITYTC